MTVCFYGLTYDEARSFTIHELHAGQGCGESVSGTCTIIVPSLDFLMDEVIYGVCSRIWSFALAGLFLSFFTTSTSVTGVVMIKKAIYNLHLNNHAFTDIICITFKLIP